MRTGRAALLGAVFCGVCALASPSPAIAGHVLFDVAERQVLEATDADAAIEPGRVADLLLIGVVREQLAAGALTPTTRVPVLAVTGDRGPRLPVHDPVEVGELLQLLLLCDSPTAAKTLAWAVGPSIGRALNRMYDVGRKLGLRHTTISDDWPFAAGLATGAASHHRGTTTARELGTVALLIATDPDMRRRLALDGVPIADGSVIVRASDPVIAVAADGPPPSGASSAAVTRVAVAERSGLALLAVATGASADSELAASLENGFRRYQRVEVVRAGQAIGPSIRVRGGIIPSFNAIAAEPWSATTRKSSAGGLAVRLQLPSEVEAPVELHQALGELVIERDGRLVAVIPLVAPQMIAPSGWLDSARASSRR